MALRILIAVVLGIAAALLLGRSATFLGPVGSAIIQAIKIAATPLLFLTILRALLETNLGWREGRRLLIVAGVNLTFAIGIGLAFSNVFRPGAHLERSIPAEKLPAIQSAPTLSYEAFFRNVVPESLLAPFVKNDVLTIVLLALVIGLAMKRSRREAGFAPEELCPESVRGALRVVEIILGWIVKLIPLAVFAAVAKSIGEYGFEPLRGLLAYVLVALAALLTHSALVYGSWIFGFARIPFRRFFAAAKEPVIYALGVNSSLATLPFTLRALDRLGISQKSSALGAGIATNLNNDGIILYEAMAILFLAQAYGMDFNFAQQLGVAFACLAAVLGVAGIPEAGFISLSVVVVAMKMPLDLLPLLLTVDWIVARARSAVNVLSDMTLSIVIDRMESPRGG